jgi:hypothetical protein
MDPDPHKTNKDQEHCLFGLTGSQIRPLGIDGQLGTKTRRNGRVSPQFCDQSRFLKTGENSPTVCYKDCTN